MERGKLRQSRARPDHKHGCASCRRLPSNGEEIGRLQCRQRPGDSFEVVEEMNCPEPKPVLQVGRIDRPSAVGDNAAIVLHRPRDPEHRGFRRGACATGEEGSDRLGRARIIGDPDMLDRPNFVSLRKRETCVGAADVREKSLLVPRSTVVHRVAVIASAEFLLICGTEGLRFPVMRLAYHRAEALGMRRCVGKST